MDDVAEVVDDVAPGVPASAANVVNALAAVPPSRVRKINGRMPINSKKYAARTVPLGDLPLEIRGRYPKSVTFNGAGSPDFTPYAIKKVDIKLGKTRDIDFDLADKAAGFGAQNPRPSGYTWHHHQQAGHMQLVPTDLHDAIKHTGRIATNKGKQ